MKRADWEAIEGEYRAGQLSVRAIAKKYGCSESSIRYRVKQYGWTRDLTEEVRRSTNSKLAGSTVPKTIDDPTDAQIVESASNMAVELIQSHRLSIAEYRQLCNLSSTRLYEQLSNGKVKILNRAGEQVEVDIPLDYVTKSLNAATGALERIIKLERQAFNIDREDGKGGADSTLAQILEEIQSDPDGLPGELE